jgi:hypothetical protein
MTTPRPQRQREKSIWKKCVLWTLAVLPVLLFAGYFAARSWIYNYLRSEEFRRFVSRATAKTLHADGEFAPLHFTGMNIYSEGFKARGSERAVFASLAIEQIRAELSLRRWRERVWQIDNLEAQRIDLQFDGSRIALEETPRETPVKPSTKPGSGWLPNRVEIGTASVQDANLSWGEAGKEAGSVRGTRLVATARDGAWEIAGDGGHLEHSGLPGLELETLHMLYRAPALYVQDARLRRGVTGSVNVNGEVRFGEAIDLQGKLVGIDVTPFLSNDWRVRLHGKLGGDVRVQGSLPSANPPVISGSLELSEGQIEALPVLDEIALFTRLQQYKRLVLSRVSADFRQENGVLRATNFITESAGLIRVEGGFNVANGQINGLFQVGVTPSSLQWLPGSQDRVFTESRAGYVWTPVRLSGPLESPGEDLSPRLVTAAKDAAIEKVGDTVQSAVETGKEVIKGALDRLMPLFK